MKTAEDEKNFSIDTCNLKIKTTLVNVTNAELKGTGGLFTTTQTKDNATGTYVVKGGNIIEMKKFTGKIAADDDNKV